MGKINARKPNVTEPLAARAAAPKKDPEFRAELAFIDAKTPSNATSKSANANASESAHVNAVERDPGMLDVRALLAENAARARASPRAASASSPGPDGHDSPAPNRARQGPTYVGPATPAVAEPARSPIWLVASLLAFAGVLTALATLASYTLPGILRDYIVGRARQANVTLTLDRVEVGLGGLLIKGLSAESDALPGVRAQAKTLHVEGPFKRTRAGDITVDGLALTLEGRAHDIQTAAALFYEQKRAFFESTTAARTVTVRNARATWTALFGLNSRLEAAGANAEFGSGSESATPELKARIHVSRITVTTPHLALGPWSGTYENDVRGISRMRIMLDPPVPEGPSIFGIDSPNASTWTVKIPRSPLVRIGLRPEDFGLRTASSPELEMTGESRENASHAIEAAGRLAIYNVQPTDARAPFDVSVRGALAGLAGKPLTLEKTTVTAGPFTAQVTGTLSPTSASPPDGFRLDASFQTSKIPCEKLVREQIKTGGPLATLAHDAVRASGLLRVTGAASASGLITYDTRKFDTVSIALTGHETCGLALFGL